MPSTETLAGRRVTMADIASAAGVSKITVSRALSGSELVKAELRKRVCETAAAMGYRMNLAARDLRLRQRMRIAVVVDMPATKDRPLYDPYPLALLGGIMQECAAAGFAIVLTTSDPRMAAEAQDAGGIIVLGQGVDHHAVRALTSLNLPLAVWGADDGVEATMGAEVVGSDNRLGGQLAARHLIARGRRRLAFLGDTHHAEIADRATGFAQGLADGAQIVAQRGCDFTRDGGRTAMADVIGEGVAFDGVFAGSDLVAIGAMEAMTAAGLRPGVDVAVVGYDDIPAAAAHKPRLTTIHQDLTEAGRLLAAALLWRLDPERFDAPRTRSLPVTLVIRET